MNFSEFLKIASRDYKRVGAITLSSKYTIKKVTGFIKPDFKYIVEYGSGTGIVTREILKALPKDGRLVAIELNDELFSELKKIKDPRLIVLKKDAVLMAKNLNNLGLPRIDAVISNIPLSFLKNADRKKIILDTYNSISSGGRFIVYQYSLNARPLLKKVFTKIKYGLELRNLPPYFVMVGDK